MNPWEAQYDTPKAAPWEAQYDVPAPSFGQQLGRSFGLAGRDALNAFGGTVGLAYDPLAALENNIFGSNVRPLRMQTDELASDIGLPKPENSVERIASGATEGTLGALGTMGAGGLLKSAAGPITSAVGDAITQLPMLQMTSGATSGAAGPAIKDIGGNEYAQAAGSLAAGMLPYAASYSLRGNVSPEVKASAERLMDEGIQPRLSQLSDSKVLKTIDSVLPNIPFSGAAASQNAQKQAVTRALTSKFGDPMDTLSPINLGNAQADLGNQYSELLKDRASYMGDLPQALQEKLAALGKQTDVGGRQFLQEQANNILENVSPQNVMSGPEYQAARINLKAARGTNPLVRELQNVLDESFRRGAGEDVAGQLSNIDKKYQALKITENIAKQLQNTGARMDGVVNPGSVYTQAKMAIPDIARGGGGDMGQFANDVSLLRETIPDTGTAGRTALLSALGGGGAATAYFNPATAPYALGAGLAGIGLARGANSAMQNPWLVRQYLKDTPENALALALALSAKTGAQQLQGGQ